MPARPRVRSRPRRPWPPLKDSRITAPSVGMQGSDQADGRFRRVQPVAVRRAPAGTSARALAATRHHGDGGGGGTTGGRLSHVMVFGNSQAASHGPVVPPPSLPPRSVSENSEPAAVKWNEPQLFTPTAPTFRASTF